MNIKIWDDKYVIKSDKYCYRLAELRARPEDIPEDDEDKDEGVTVGYYPTILDLFEDLVNMEGRLNRCTTLEGYVRHIERVHNELEKTLDRMRAVIGTKESVARILSLGEHLLPDEVKEVGEEPTEEKPKRGRKKKVE